MSDASLLSTLVQESTQTKRLAQLTNDDGTSTINTTYLEKICERAIGEFKQISGVSPVLTANAENFNHVNVLEDGVLYFLEKKKGNDVNVMDKHRSLFYAGCKTIRENTYSNAETNSDFALTQRQANTVKDFDPNRLVMKGKRATITQEGFNTI